MSWLRIFWEDKNESKNGGVGTTARHKAVRVFFFQKITSRLLTSVDRLWYNVFNNNALL